MEPFATCCMISMEVNCLVMEPSRNFTSGVLGMFHSRLARPYPFLKMTLSWSETKTVPVNEQQSAYCDMSLSIFAALPGVSAAERDETCQGRIKRRTQKINFFMASSHLEVVLLLEPAGILHPRWRRTSSNRSRESSPWLPTRWLL